MARRYSIAVSEAGKRFYEEALKILAQTDYAVESARQAASGASGMLRLGFSGNAFFANVISAPLRAFRLCYPDVRLTLKELPTGQQLQALQDATLDVAVMPCFSRHPPQGIITHRLRRWRWIVGVGDNHPLAHRATLTAASLIHERFIIYGDSKDNHGQINALTHLLGQTPFITDIADSTVTTLTLISAGYGIALLPASFLSLNAPGVIYKALPEFEAQAELNIYYRQTTERATVENFLATMRSIGDFNLPDD